MKEFSVQLESILGRGLRTLNKETRKSPQFISLINMEPSDQGLVPYNYVTSPFDQSLLYMHGIQFQYPFPQLFVMKNKAILATSTKLYLVDMNSWNDLYELDLYDSDNPANIITITPGDRWHVGDMGDTWFLANGKDIVYFTHHEVMIGGSEKVYVKKDFPINTICYYKGRIILGGFDYNKFWNSTWQSFWNSWITKKTDTGLSFTRNLDGSDILMPVGKNWLWWSSIGGGDVRFLFSTTDMQTGYMSSSYSSSKPFILDILKKNEQGFSQLPFPGDLIKVKELGDYLIAYTTTGVMALRHVIEPVPTLRHIDIPELENVGLLSAGAVDGDKSHHIFIDTSGALWHLGFNERGNIEATPLGYREYINPMVGTDPSVIYAQNPMNLDRFGEFYINSASYTYKLVKNGLLKTGQKLTSARYIEGTVVGICDDYDDEQEGSFITDVIDFNDAGMKTIMSVDVLLTQIRYTTKEKPKVWIAIDYRERQNKEFSTTSYRQINDEGNVHFPVSGIDFRIRLKVDNYRRQDIGKLRVNYQAPDRRFKRSLDVTET